MLKLLAFSDWTPDTPATSGMTEATNALPFAATADSTSYRPVGAFAPATPALPSAWAGGAAFVGSDGTSSLLCATGDGLYRFSGGAWSQVLAVASTGPWRFAQFGDNIVCANGGAPIAYDAIAGTAGPLAGSPPTAKLVATVRDFVLLGQPDGNILKVRWSGFNDSANWTLGGTDNQADEQEMLEGGEVMGLAGGEYGIVLQRHRIVRMTYTGGDVIFQFDAIEPTNEGIGCMAQGSVCQVGRRVFYLSERGFMMCDGTQVLPIGEDKIDRTFFEAYSRTDIEANLWSAADPRQSVVMWSMPGNPGRIWHYNWAADRWGAIDTGLAGIFPGFSANISLETIDSDFPGGLDALPYSLDDPRFAGGNALLYVVDPTFQVGTLSGPAMAATLATQHDQPVEGRRISLRSVRAVTDAAAMTITVDGRARLADVQTSRSTSIIRSNGQMPIRFNAQWVSPRLDIAAGETWSFAQGIELEYEAGAGK